MLEDWMSQPPVAAFPMSRGTMTLWRPNPCTLITQANGYLTEKAMAEVLKHKTQVLTGPDEGLFVHLWDGLTGYETGARLISGAWVRRHEGAAYKIHVSATATLIRMGVSVVATFSHGRLMLHDNAAAMRFHFHQMSGG